MTESRQCQHAFCGKTCTAMAPSKNQDRGKIPGSQGVAPKKKK